MSLLLPIQGMAIFIRLNCTHIDALSPRFEDGARSNCIVAGPRGHDVTRNFLFAFSVLACRPCRKIF